MAGGAGVFPALSSSGERMSCSCGGERCFVGSAPASREGAAGVCLPFLAAKL